MKRLLSPGRCILFANALSVGVCFGVEGGIQTLQRDETNAEQFGSHFSLSDKKCSMCSIMHSWWFDHIDHPDARKAAIPARSGAGLVASSASASASVTG